jgi:type II secretory pathway pseudopilin PulG
MTVTKNLQNQRGVALIFVLVAVTLLGLMAGIAGSSWQTIVQRAKEQELLWRGGQIRKAIGSYYKTAHGGAKSGYPASFEQLLKDPRFISTKRHLRRHYLDPITGDDWELIKAPNGRIKGVRSHSDKEPFKKDNFSKENEKLVGKMKYAEWEFIYLPKKQQKTSTQPPGPENKPIN